MAEPFIAEIRLFAGAFAPRGWAFCHGQVLPIAQNQALFSLLGVTYGGDGRVTFALPDLRGCLPVHTGTGQVPGLTPRMLGERFGAEAVALDEAQMPRHAHTLSVSADQADARSPTAGPLGVADSNAYAPPDRADTALAPEAILPAGGGAPHENLPPFLVLNYIIALQGIFPARN